MTTSREIVFIDQNISDLSSLLAGLRPDVEPIVLTASECATAQIATALKGRNDVPAVHVIAHGRAGEVSFGAGALSLETLADHATELAAIGRALGGNGDLLLWSCNAAEGERGSAFVAELAHLAAANVAAASGRVGAEARGGRWELDARADVRAPLTADGMAAYAGVMSTHLESFSLTAITDDAGPDDFLTNDHTLVLNGSLNYNGSDGTNQTTSFELWLSGGEFGANTLVGTFSFPPGFLPGDPSETSTVDWSFDLSTLGISAAQFLNDGTYTLSLVDASPSGGTLPVSAGGNAQFIIDSTLDFDPPTAAVDIIAITDDTGTNGDFLTKDTVLSVSGTNGALGAGEIVQVSSDGLNWFAVTQDTATTWHYDDPATHGSNFVYQARVIDAALNIGNIDSQAVVIDTVPPTASITLNAITADNVVNAAEAGGPVAVTGSVGGDVQVGDTVTLTVNGVDYTGLVQVGGTFSINVPGSGLAADANTTVDASVTTTDTAGNSDTATDIQVYAVDTTAPTITISDIAGDNIVNDDEAAADIVISGTTTDVEDGQLVTLTLRDAGNNVIETVTTTVTGNAWSYTVTGGTIPGGNDGTYTVEAEVTDLAGNPASDTQEVILDETLPTITISDIAGDNIVNDDEAAADIVISGTTTDVEDGQLVTLTLRDAGNNVIETVTTTVTGNAWSYTVTGGTIPGGNDGTYTVEAEVTDLAGNPASDTQEVILDETLPTITISDIAGDNIVNDDEAAADIVISGTTTDVEDGQLVTLTLRDAGNNVIETVTTTVTGNAWSYTVTGGTIPGGNDGTYTVEAEVTDLAGNPASDTQEVILDETLPTITISDIAGDNIVNDDEAAADIVISGTTTDVEDGQLVTLTLRDAGNNVIETVTTTVTGNAWSYTVTGGTIPGGNDGTYTVEAEVTDLAGNPASDTQEVILDETLPTITISDIAGDNIVNDDEAAADIVISGTTTDVEDGQLVTLTLRDAGNNVIETVTTTVTGNAWSYTVTGGTIPGGNDGTYTVEAEVTDLAGNPASDTQEVILDETLPTITISDIAGDNIVNDDEAAADIVISGTTTDVEDGQLVTLTLRDAGNNVIETVTTTVTGNAWSYTVTGGTIPGGNDGTYTVEAEVTDLAGNPASDTQEVILDETLPTITISDIAGDNIVNDDEAAADIVISGTTTDVEDGQLVTLTLRDAGNNVIETVTTTVTGNAWSYTVTGGTIPGGNDGTYTVEAEVTDLAGNPASDTQEVILDETADTGTVASVTIDDGDGFINDAEDDAVDFTVAGVDPDATATVTFTSSGGGTAVVVSGLGNGTSTADLSGLNDGTVTATISATDTAGNTAAGSGDTSVLDTTVAASITLNAITADNLIDFAEVGGTVAVTGSVGGNVQNGDTVTLAVNGATYTGVVASGLFSINVAGSDLEADADTTVDASVTTTDLAGNSATAADSQAYDVDDTPPGPQAVPLLEDVIWVHDDRTVSTATTILGVLGATTDLVARGDFDGDGDDDVLLYTDATHVTYWELQDGHFVQAHDLADASRTWNVVGSGDFDADGDDDILWRNENGLVVTWEMQDGEFLQHHHLPVDDHNADVDPTFGTPDTWEIQGTGDFDGDGDDDILWRHRDGAVATWEMEDGLYVVNHNLPDVPTNWEIEGVADLDRDGDDDIVWRHEEGLVVAWEMEDGAYVVNHNFESVPANLHFQGSADFDDDGDNDLLWRQDDGEVVTWTMENGAHVDTTSFGIIDLLWHIRATGEFPLA